jgi:hypothetical protein
VLAKVTGEDLEVAVGDADCGLGVYSAAQLMNLDFIALGNAEYDFAVPVKINAVLMRGFNDTEFEAFLNLTRDIPIEIRFIELMPIGEGDSRSVKVMSQIGG